MIQHKVRHIAEQIMIDGITYSLPFTIRKVLVLPESLIVLFDPDAWREAFGQFHNLRAYDFHARPLWEAELPTSSSGDCYWDIGREDSLLTARSWSSYDCIIDVRTGRLHDKQFYK